MKDIQLDWWPIKRDVHWTLTITGYSTEDAWVELIRYCVREGFSVANESDGLKIDTGDAGICITREDVANAVRDGEVTC